MNRIVKTDPFVEIEHSKRIIGLRNHIIHSYDNVVDEILWGIIINYLPLLEAEVRYLLEEE